MSDIGDIVLNSSKLLEYFSGCTLTEKVLGREHAYDAIVVLNNVELRFSSDETKMGLSLNTMPGLKDYTESVLKINDRSLFVVDDGSRDEQVLVLIDMLLAELEKAVENISNRDTNGTEDTFLKFYWTWRFGLLV